jgi:hypothetical protein
VDPHGRHMTLRLGALVASIYMAYPWDSIYFGLGIVGLDSGSCFGVEASSMVTDVLSCNTQDLAWLCAEEHYSTAVSRTRWSQPDGFFGKDRVHRGRVSTESFASHRCLYDSPTEQDCSRPNRFRYPPHVSVSAVDALQHCPAS